MSTNKINRIFIIGFTFIFLLTSMNLVNQSVAVKGNVTEEEGTTRNEGETGTVELTTGVEGESTTEETTSQEPTTEEPTTEEPTTEEPTKPEYEIIDGLYKVKDGILIEFLSGEEDKSLTEITIPAVIKIINPSIFQNHKYLKKVSFQSGSELTSIGMEAFKNCTALSEITLPGTLDTIGNYAFSGCTALKSIALPNKMTTIGFMAFEKCSSLSSLTIPEFVTQADTILGSETGVKTVVFSSGMSFIPEKILCNASTVTKIVMSDGVTVIKTRAFYNCTGLKKMSVAGTVKEIQSYSFYGCKNMESFTTPKEMTKIGKYAFKKCTALKVFVLRKTLTAIGKGAFSKDKNLMLQVYANSVGKTYARKNNLNWEYTASEKKRREKNEAIYNQFMSQVSVADQSRFQLKELNNYVPQGTTVIGKYLVVSMYQKNLKSRSFLLLYDKNTGKFVKKLYLQSVDHVGSMVTIKNRLVIGINNISLFDYVGVINYSTLKKAKNNKVVKYNYKRFLGTYVDFAGYDGTNLWTGHCSTISAPVMAGFKVKVKKKKLYFTRAYTFVAPQNVQGLIVRKGKNSSRTFIFSQSYGRLNNSTLLKYKIKLKKNTTLGVPISENTIPSMSEGICMDSNKNIYIVFESASGLYCGNPDNTSEIQIDKVCRIKSTALSKLAK